MARPRKKGLDYFPLDINIFSDEKIVTVSGQFGCSAELIYIKLLCAIYKNGYYLPWSDMVMYKLIKELDGATPEYLQNVIHAMVKYNLFDKELFLNEGVLTSQGIQERYFEAVKFRLLDEGLPYLLSFPRINYAKERVSQTETRVSQGLTPQKKRKEIIKKSTPKVVDEKDENCRKNSGGDSSVFLPEGMVMTQLLKADEEWQECLIKHFGLTKGELDDAIDDFRGFCVSEGKCHHDLADIKSHFKRWLQSDGAQKGRKKFHEKPEEHILDIESALEDMKADAVYLAAVADLYGLNPEDVVAYVSKFKSHCISENIIEVSVKAMRQHFKRWLPKFLTCKNIRRKDFGCKSQHSEVRHDGVEEASSPSELCDDWIKRKGYNPDNVSLKEVILLEAAKSGWKPRNQIAFQ